MKKAIAILHIITGGTMLALGILGLVHGDRK